MASVVFPGFVCVWGWGGGLETRVLHRLHILFLFSLTVHNSLGACKAAIWYTQMYTVKDWAWPAPAPTNLNIRK